MSEAALAAAPPRPALPERDLYPERADPPDGWIDRFGVAVEGMIACRLPRLYIRGMERMARLVEARGAAVAALSDAALKSEAAAVGRELRRRGFAEADVARAFALVREVATRTVGLRHFPVQLMGGYVLLKGGIAEIDTGEGKTLVATLPAATAALAGVPVHVITVNDYLAERDAELTRPIYNFLGLSVGVVKQGMDQGARRRAYRADIAYCTNKEIAFDYLRDRMQLADGAGNLRLKVARFRDGAAGAAGLVMRGLPFAIVDEADSVLVDEARTPLIISGEIKGEEDAAVARQALELAAALRQGRDFRLQAADRQVELLRGGRERVKELTAALDGPWRRTVLREELTRMALSAIHLFERDEHYLVADGKVQIVDEYTGRVMPDRQWSEGLHQMIEVKEDCEPTGRRVTLARITYQRFFRRYRRLAGMTGTAREVASELFTVYRLPVIRVPTNRPARRRVRPDLVLPSEAEKWRAVVARIAELHREGAPVLLGTRSVAASEAASRYLAEAGLPHLVLSAAQDKEEAEIVAMAGQRGRITVATNMAGRGTDIRLGPGVEALGGLHVIMSERHDAQRIDRQLAGRCGRQGEPGSVEAILSLRDPLLTAHRAGPLVRLSLGLGRWGGRMALRQAQRGAERNHSRIRKELMRHDRLLGQALAFSGQME